MNFKPMNRHLYVKPIKQEQEEDLSMILLPNDFQKPESPYVICDVIDKSEDCEIGVKTGDRIIVENRMLHQIFANGETIYIVLQNYVYGRIEQ